MKQKKSICCFTAMLLGLSLMPASMGVYAADEMPPDQQEKGTTEDGYDWELWNQYGKGTVDMTVGEKGTFSCSWKDIQNVLFRSGKKLGSEKKWDEYGGIQIEYDVDYEPLGNSYMCVYGWTEDPTVEYYIVEAWGDWRPPGISKGKATLTVDGKEYDVYTSTRYEQPSIHGTETFEQYWSVQKKNPAVVYSKTNLKGTISVSSHFKQWEALGMKMGTMYEVALNIEGYQANGSAVINKNDLNMNAELSDDVKVEITDQTPEVEAAEIAGASESLTDDFEKGTSSWIGRGGVTGVASKGYNDSKKSLVSYERSDYWNGFQSSSAEVAAGCTYDFEAYMMCEEDNSFLVGVQYNDEEGTTHYDNINSVKGKAGEWTKLTGEVVVPKDVTSISIYVQAGSEGEATPAFYMDDVKLTKTAEEADDTERPLFGDVDENGVVELTDLTNLSLYLLGDMELSKSQLLKANVQYNAVVDIADLTTLKQYICKDPDVKELGKDYDPNVVIDEPTDESIVKITNKVVNGVLTSTCNTSWIPVGSKVTAISFDDGPVPGGKNPQRIQDALTKSGFHATFFYQGNKIKGYEKEIKNAFNAGFEVASHTWTHSKLTEQADFGAAEIVKTKETLDSIIGGDNDYTVRAPYLDINSDVLKACGVPFPNCGIDTKDWDGASTDSIVNTIKSNMTSGALKGKVVLCHENYDTTASAMEEVFPYMKDNGWVNASVVEMFKYYGKELKAGVKYDGC